MKKTLTALALIATASASNAHQYNQGGFEIDAFYKNSNGPYAHVELTVHEPLKHITCRLLDSNEKPVASETLHSYVMTMGWNSMMILHREGADVKTVKCQSRK